MWFDRKVDEIESKYEGSETKTINGKTYTLKRENTDLFKYKEYVRVFGEHPFIKGKLVIPKLSHKLWDKDTKFTKSDLIRSM